MNDVIFAGRNWVLFNSFLNFAPGVDAHAGGDLLYSEFTKRMAATSTRSIKKQRRRVFLMGAASSGLWLVRSADAIAFEQAVSGISERDLRNCGTVGVQLERLEQAHDLTIYNLYDLVAFDEGLAVAAEGEIRVLGDYGWTPVGREALHFTQVTSVGDLEPAMLR